MSIFKVYRFIEWYYYLGYVVLGFLLKSTLNMDIIKHILLGAFLLAYAFSFNDFNDKHEKKKFFILPLILSFLLLIFFNIFQIIISLSFLIIVTFYSSSTFRLKAKPFLSSLCNGFGFTIIFLLGHFYTMVFKIESIFFIILFFSLNMVAQFIHEAAHLKKDKKDKIITTALFYGEKNIKIFCYFFLFIVFLTNIYLLLLKSINIFFFLSLVFFIIFFIFEIKRRKIDIITRKRYKFFGVVFGIIFLLSILITNLPI